MRATLALILVASFCFADITLQVRQRGQTGFAVKTTIHAADGTAVSAMSPVKRLLTRDLPSLHSFSAQGARATGRGYNMSFECIADAKAAGSSTLWVRPNETILITCPRALVRSGGPTTQKLPEPITTRQGSPYTSRTHPEFEVAVSGDGSPELRLFSTSYQLPYYATKTPTSTAGAWTSGKVAFQLGGNAPTWFLLSLTGDYSLQATCGSRKRWVTIPFPLSPPSASPPEDAILHLNCPTLNSPIDSQHAWWSQHTPPAVVPNAPVFWGDAPGTELSVVIHRVAQPHTRGSSVSLVCTDDNCVSYKAPMTSHPLEAGASYEPDDVFVNSTELHGFSVKPGTVAAVLSLQVEGFIAGSSAEYACSVDLVPTPTGCCS